MFWGLLERLCGFRLLFWLDDELFLGDWDFLWEETAVLVEVSLVFLLRVCFEDALDIAPLFWMELAQQLESLVADSPSAVVDVVDDAVADGLQVHSDLVRPAGQRVAGDEGSVGGFVVPDDLEPGERGLGLLDLFLGDCDGVFGTSAGRPRTSLSRAYLRLEPSTSCARCSSSSRLGTSRCSSIPWP